MGKPQKKGVKGNAANYMTRNQALKKLQLTLPEFRKLCILKGIYPREPKKKVRGSDKTYYLQKDVMFLAHDPLIHQARRYQAWRKKVKRARGRREYQNHKRLQQTRPRYEIAPVVRERYPTFTSALSDMDDALCMIYLFAGLPQTRKFSNRRGALCKRLCAEWEYYIVRSGSLRRTFVSTRGIYYQAVVCQQSITWLVPFHFPMRIPKDVDERVMLSFLELYQCLTAFVMYRLYHQLDLRYPPGEHVLAAAAGDHASILEMDKTRDQASMKSKSSTAESAVSEKEMKKRLASLSAKMHTIGEGSEAMDDSSASEEEETSMMEEEEEDEEESDGEELENNTAPGGLRSTEPSAVVFRGCRILLGRECAQASLSFVIRAGGGAVELQQPGVVMDDKDSEITHQACDRSRVPSESSRNPNRDYVQPQWIYDSINNGTLLPVEEYLVGRPLPPHLSPFVDDQAEGYVPERRAVLDAVVKSRGISLGGQEDEEKSSSKTEENAEALEEGSASSSDESDLEALEKQYQESIRAEAEGGQGEEEQDEMEAPTSTAVETAASRKARKAKQAAAREKEEEELLSVMMSRRKKRLYDRIQYSKRDKERKAAKLLSKRKK